MLWVLKGFERLGNECGALFEKLLKAEPITRERIFIFLFFFKWKMGSQQLKMLVSVEV